MKEFNKYRLTRETIKEYEKHLRSEDYAPDTIKKYIRDLRKFCTWMDGQLLQKELATEWRDHLFNVGYAPVTVNSMLAALNGYLRFCGLAWKVKFLRIQRQIFRDPNRELIQSEYMNLVVEARRLGRTRLALIMETVCATGIRVSEVKYITVESVQKGRAEIRLKGKIRSILLPGKLCKKLFKYIKKEKITFGEIFLTKGKKRISRQQIWAEMKRLCATAKVESTKVFPHNLRHLFARTFYRIYRDIVRLADTLGHSSIETTRIYLRSTDIEYRKKLERLGLIS